MMRSTELWCVGHHDENAWGGYWPYLTEDNKLLVFPTRAAALAWVETANTALATERAEWEERRDTYMTTRINAEQTLYEQRRKVLQDAGLWVTENETEPLTRETIWFPERPPQPSSPYEPIKYSKNLLDMLDLTEDDLVGIDGSEIFLNCTCVACLTEEASKETSIEDKIAVFAAHISCPKCESTGCPHAKNHTGECWVDTLLDTKNQ